MERTYAVAVLEDLQPWEGPALKEVMKEGCIQWEGPYAGGAEEPEEEETPETKHYVSQPPAAQGGKKVEGLGVKLSLGKREGWREGVFIFVLISHYLTLINWQYIIFPKLSLFCM